MYIYQKNNWPNFYWEIEKISEILVSVRHKQGRLIGRMEGMGFHLQSEATLSTITLDVLKSSEIEGEILDKEQVRSSIARKLGLDIGGLVPADRNVEGIVEMMLDATQNYSRKLSIERLFDWHAALFPTGRSGMKKIIVAAWRTHGKDDPMRVISGPMGRERVHFQAPDADKVEHEMKSFIRWFNETVELDPVLKAAIIHLQFVTIHPFDDGNGRIARALTDMQLARADQSVQRFYSMSSQIRKERKEYYTILEKTQKGDLDITNWIIWFLRCLDRAIDNSEENLSSVLSKWKFWDRHSSAILNERQRKMINKLFSDLEGKLTSSKWAKMNKCSQDTAGRDINDLMDKGILLKEAGGGRSTSYTLHV